MPWKVAEIDTQEEEATVNLLRYKKSTNENAECEALSFQRYVLILYASNLGVKLYHLGIWLKK